MANQEAIAVISDINKLINDIGNLDINQTVDFPAEPCIFVFDTETTGFGNNDRIIEIGYIIYDKHGVEIKRFSTLIYHDIKIKNSYIHGIKDISKGRKMVDVLEIIMRDIAYCDTIVAHNLSFDMRMLKRETFNVCRELYMHLNDMQQVCTMKLSKDKLKLKRGLKLSLLYNQLFDVEYEQLHRALDDTRMCAMCYFEMR